MQLICFFRSSMIYPGKMTAAAYDSVPFKLTKINLRNINQWLPTIKSLPQAQYVTKVILATPVKIDVDIQPTCPACEADADFVPDSQTEYFCLQRCDVSTENGPFQPLMKVLSTVRLDIDDGRKYRALPALPLPIRLRSTKYQSLSVPIQPAQL